MRCMCVRLATNLCVNIVSPKMRSRLSFAAHARTHKIYNKQISIKIGATNF